MKYLLIFIISFSIFAQAKDPVVADINGTKITKNDLEAEYKQRLLYPSHKKITLDTVLQSMINKKLGVQKARSEKLQNENFIKNRYNDILHNALISRDLEPKYSKIKVSDAEVKNYYKNNKEYRTSHILYRVRAVPPKKEIETALKIMAQIAKEIKKQPSKFEELAKKHSQISTNQSGGDIGFLPPTSMSPEYYATIQGKNVGYISEIIRTQFGFHIVKITGIKKFEDIDKKLYKKIVFDMKRDKILEDYYARLKKSAKVKVYKDRL